MGWGDVSAHRFVTLMTMLLTYGKPKNGSGHTGITSHAAKGSCEVSW